MIIQVKVNTKARKNNIIHDREMYKVNLTTPPIKGKANRALITLLADYFQVSKSQITILKGEKSPQKTIQIINTSKPGQENRLLQHTICYRDKHKDYLSKHHCWER